jgi:hypothetical protein
LVKSSTTVNVCFLLSCFFRSELKKDLWRKWSWFWGTQNSNVQHTSRSSQDSFDAGVCVAYDTGRLPKTHVFFFTR